MATHQRNAYLLTVILVAISLAGCETMSESGRTKAQGAGIGAVVCGTLAAVLTKDCDDNDADCDTGEKRLKNAAKWAAICGAAGYAYGSHVAAKKEEYASQESYLDAVLAEAYRVQDETRQSNNELIVEIAALERRVSELERDQSSAEALQRELEGVREQTKNQLEAANTQLGIVNREIAIQEAVLKEELAQAPEDYELRAVTAIDGLGNQRESLERYIKQLEAIDERVIR